jgi:lactate permease
MAISQMIGRTLPILSIFLPFYIVVLMSGFKKTIEILPAVIVSGGSFACLQWFSSNFLGPALPDIIAGIGSIVCLMICLKFWKPKTVWRFPNEPAPTISNDINYRPGEIVRAWSPFILLTIMVIAWGMQPIKQVFNSVGLIQFEIPGLHNAIMDKNNSLLPHIFKFNYLSAAGTSIFLSAIISIPLVGLKFSDALKVFWATLGQLKYSILTVALVLGFAYSLNDSGITMTMAEALANTGFLFPFFAPVLGWLGVFITGSDTSANALFGKLQSATASSIGVDPVITVAANASGGVVGKMISPQSIAVASAAGNLVGRESELFRFTVKHSFIMLLFICLFVLAQAYLFNSIVPIYQALTPKATIGIPDHFQGYIYLLVLACLLSAFVVVIKTIGRNKARVQEGIL